ncbi:MAG: hypothetical protein IIC90_10780 [Chloroflexi bacterium]|nr:hypothetical protein [Chloroflexota bacterium]
MSIRKPSKPGRLAAFGIVVVALAAVIIVFVNQQIDTAQSSIDGAAMSMAISQTVTCPGGKAQGDVCVAINTSFTVTVSADAIPLTNGYVGYSTFIQYGATGLTFKSATSLWPDNAAFLTSEIGNGVTAGGLSGVIAPPASFHKGDLVSFDFNCTAGISQGHVLTLETLGGPNAGTSGAAYAPFPAGSVNIAATGDTITLHCTNPIPPPTPTPVVLALNVNSSVDAVDAVPGDFVCETAGEVCTLRAAIMEANALAALAVTTISVPASTYKLTIAGNSEDSAVTGDLDITHDVTIIGAGADSTIVAQSTNDRVFDIRDIFGEIDVLITGLTIADGAPPIGQGGGGIRNLANLTLVDSTIRDNAAFNGGGGVFQSGATALIASVTISNNAARTTGGAIGSSSSTLTVLNSTISGNTAGTTGGAIYQEGASPDVNLINATITGNIADADNNGSGAGGGVALSSGTSTVRNTIIAGNSSLNGAGPNCSGTWTSAGYNLVGHDEGCTFAATSGDQVGTLAAPIDPLLGPLTDNGGTTLTHAIHGASPAVDAANPATPGSGGDACEALDQRGVARPIDGDLDTNAFCDIGAYEAPEAPACSGVLCLILDMDVGLFVTVDALGLSNAPCNASGVMHLALDAVGDSNGAPNGKEDQAFTIDFVSGWVTCPGPMSGGSSIPSGGYIEEQIDTTPGLDFPADVTLILCLKIDTTTVLGPVENCQAGFPKTPIVLTCIAASYDDFDCTVITIGGTPDFMDTLGTPVASVDGSDTITMTALGQLDYPGDSDGDGCADANENQAKSEVANGGGRDSLHPWDWYDVNKDGVIDLLFDILGVINHYSPTGAPPYDITFDRGPTAGPNAWNMTAPDGVIDLLNDVLGVILQYNPTGCT